jgi:putative SOS response-associated peptidase YedK
MCGRFALTATPDQTAAFLGLAEVEQFPARYNIAPTQPVLMAISGPPRAPGSNLPDRRPMLVRWGLIPAWVKDVSEFPLLFNARSEGVIEKASFKAAIRHRRALVPASGFYEWRQARPGEAGGRKGQPYWIRPRHGGLVAFAGLVETYAEPGGSELDTGAILTVEANADIAHIHDRMPVVIAPEDFTRWLDCRGLEPRDVADLLRPAQRDFFEAIPVSDLVNKVANTGPEIQEKGEIGPEPEKVKRRKPGADDSQMTLF